MTHFRPGSQMYQLLTLLSVVGEFPTRSLHLLGSARVYKTLVLRLTKRELFRDSETGEDTECRLLTVAGKGAVKTVRLYKGALPLLAKLGAFEYYMNAFWGHKFPGDRAHRERNFRVAEVVAICMNADIETRPYRLQKLASSCIASIVQEHPSLYLSRELKRVGETEMNKTMFTRMVGALFSGRECYAVYNTRSSAMKWNGMGEFKALHNLLEIGRLNGGIQDINRAILFGESDSVAIRTLLGDEERKDQEHRFDSIYRHIHFVPMSDFGAELLRILALPNWNEKLLSLLFPAERRSYNQGVFEYDAYIDGVYIISHLDGDLARLIRFREAILSQNGNYEVLCFPKQAEFVRSYLGELVTLKTIEMSTVQTALGLKRR